MSLSILLGRFDNGDFECWLREFNACCDANGWKVTEERDDKILKLPAFLRVTLQAIFTLFPQKSVPSSSMLSRSFETPFARLFNAKLSMRCLKVVFFLPERILRYINGSLRIFSLKPTPTSRWSEDGTDSTSVHERTAKSPQINLLKLLEHNPTPTLEEMLAFVQRYRAVKGFASPAPGNDFSVAIVLASHLPQTTQNCRN